MFLARNNLNAASSLSTLTSAPLTSNNNDNHNNNSKPHIKNAAYIRTICKSRQLLIMMIVCKFNHANPSHECSLLVELAWSRATKCYISSPLRFNYRQAQETNRRTDSWTLSQTNLASNFIAPSKFLASSRSLEAASLRVSLNSACTVCQAELNCSCLNVV